MTQGKASTPTIQALKAECASHWIPDEKRDNSQAIQDCTAELKALIAQLEAQAK